MGKYFGTDGIRGVANETLTPELAYKVGRFIGCYYDQKEKAKIIVGKDTRLSSTMLEHALAAGLSASGADVYLAGFTSTPCLAYLTENHYFSCGVMISASHNPYYDNGIKIFADNGLKIDDELESLIEKYIDDPKDVDYASKDHIGKIIDYHGAIRTYQEWLGNQYEVYTNKNILVDLANGSNCYTAKDVLKRTRANVTYINDKPDGTNINNGCGSTHLEMLANKVKEGTYDLGFAFDGDADRVLFVDEDGVEVNGDKIIYFLAKYLKDNSILDGNTVVVTVMSNLGLYKALKELDINVETVSVGDKNVVDCLISNEYCLGGEQSGHIICTHDSVYGDGLKTALLVLEALEYYGVSLKEAVKDIQIYPQLLVNSEVSDKDGALNDEDVKALVSRIEAELKDDGRILVRASGTEPLLRVMVEAVDEATCKKYVDEVVELIKTKGYTK